MAAGAGYRGIWSAVSYEEGGGFRCHTRRVEGSRKDSKFKPSAQSRVQCTISTKILGLVLNAQSRPNPHAKNLEFCKCRGLQSVWSRVPGAQCRV